MTIPAAENFGLKKLFAQGDHPAAPGAWLRGSLGASALVVGRWIGISASAPSNTSMPESAARRTSPSSGSMGSLMRRRARSALVLNPMSASPATGTLAQTSFTQCSVVRSLAGTLTVYGFSADMGLFVVRQSGYDRTKMGTSFAGDQTWGPVFQLDQRMARLYPDPSLSDTPG